MHICRCYFLHSFFPLSPSPTVSASPFSTSVDLVWDFICQTGWEGAEVLLFQLKKKKFENQWFLTKFCPPTQSIRVSDQDNRMLWESGQISLQLRWVGYSRAVIQASGHMITSSSASRWGHNKEWWRVWRTWEHNPFTGGSRTASSDGCYLTKMEIHVYQICQCFKKIRKCQP